MRPRASGWLALALLPCLAWSATTPAAKPAAKPVPALPTLEDPAAEWDKFLAGSGLDNSVGAYDVLHKMYGEDHALDADCAAHLDELDQAIIKVPVAVALWDAGEKCARLTKDEVRASRYGEGLLKLASFALARDSSGPLTTPIRVLNINDINALIDATGMELLYSYVDVSRFPQWYPLTMALWDKDAGVERHLAFDFLDSLTRVKTDGEHSGFPVYRMRLRESMIDAQKEDADLFGQDLAAVRATGDVSGAKEKLAALRETAAAGGLQSITAWLRICNPKPFPDCGEGLVDALLPLAEDKLAMYRVELALAYARGIGVDKDLDAAMVLLDSAEARWNGGNAISQFAEQWMDLDKTPLPAPVIARLEKSASQGSLRASAARLRAFQQQAKDDTLSKPALELAQSLGKAGVAPARIALAEHYFAVGQPGQAIEWLRKGAEAGDADASERYASELFYGEHQPRQEKAGLEWMGKAAARGDTQAMRWMGEYSERLGKWHDAEGWYLSAVAYDDWRGLQALAEFYSQPHEGVGPGPARALELFTALDRLVGNAEIRRSFASLLMGSSKQRDLPRARKLLQQDADAGDAQSQYELGMALIEGKLGKAETDAGLAWIGKALARDEGQLSDGFAYYLFYRQGSAAARQQALKLERGIMQVHRYLPGLNNLAWWLCTSPDASVRNPAEGLTVVAKMGKPEQLQATTLDTVAACHAANGDFDQAVQLQSLALDRQQLLGGSASVIEQMRSRLDGYRKKQAYVEKSGDD